MHTKISLENLKGRDHVEGIGVNEKIILEWMLHRLGSCGLNSSGKG